MGNSLKVNFYQLKIMNGVFVVDCQQFC